MRNSEPDILVQRFVDGDLSEGEVQEALHRIADDADARTLLQFELRVTQDLAASRSSRAPRDFADRTMEAVAREPTPERASETGFAPLLRWWKAVTEPVSVQVRPVSAAISVLLGAAVLIGVLSPAGWPADNPIASQTNSESSPVRQAATQQQPSAETTERGQTVWIRFMYTDNDADSVAVAGDFSQWEPVTLSPREVEGETVWTGLVPVSRGEHEYQFLINGEQWVTDPLASVKRSDGFGAENAVLNI